MTYVYCVALWKKSKDQGEALLCQGSSTSGHSLLLWDIVRLLQLQKTDDRSKSSKSLSEVWEPKAKKVIEESST